MTKFKVNGTIYHGYTYAHDNYTVFYIRIKRTGETFRVPACDILSPMSSVINDLKK